MKYFHYHQPFPLENGASLPELTIAYHTYGTLRADSKVVWICHALTANSDVADWWKGVVGQDYVVNPDQYFIVCANILGSCYGTTGPLSNNPTTGQPYYHQFPLITIRDMVQAHILLRRHLGIERIYLLMGGSMGGYQAMEWCIQENSLIDRLFLLATSPTESAWGIAIHATQRLAIEADSTWQENAPYAGSKGLKAARAVGMLTYRNYGIMVQKQTDPDGEKLDAYRAASYINYQGDKLVKRFNAFSYWTLTKAMDTHNLGRGRGGHVDALLQTIRQQTLIIGISSDILCPLIEQRHIQAQLPNATLVEIDSAYGHDGFMVEGEKISQCLQNWLGN
ncbi:homoserine O-acetyltransferase [Paraflavitalea sp. CAU 1676]|uniref:homoserine O-acetyltransferase family protein n=1 Tax=Paraflavitalea sp. CAU 1676 TaxID=3032598 RepID=UPI0023D9A762|nr:homoserine O-acetyltransferase [Paraflavitalea sp. CAU 1676]MDF2193069.1 homoserine O-acetyltransferase [Paraflavitalea sp. CAU 1676]